MPSLLDCVFEGVDWDQVRADAAVEEAAEGERPTAPLPRGPESAELQAVLATAKTSETDKLGKRDSNKQRKLNDQTRAAIKHQMVPEALAAHFFICHASCRPSLLATTKAVLRIILSVALLSKKPLRTTDRHSWSQMSMELPMPRRLPPHS